MCVPFITIVRLARPKRANSLQFLHRQFGWNANEWHTWIINCFTCAPPLVPPPSLAFSIDAIQPSKWYSSLTTGKCKIAPFVLLASFKTWLPATTLLAYHVCILFAFAAISGPLGTHGNVLWKMRQQCLKENSIQFIIRVPLSVGRNLTAKKSERKLVSDVTTDVNQQTNQCCRRQTAQKWCLLFDLENDGSQNSFIHH